MNDQELRVIAESLEQAVSGEPQSLLLKAHPWPILRLNRDGCLAFAADLLRLAAHPPATEGHRVTRRLSNIDQMLDGDDSFVLWHLERADGELQETAERQIVETPARDRFALIGCAFIGFLVLMTFCGGIFFWARLFFGQN